MGVQTYVKYLAVIYILFGAFAAIAQTAVPGEYLVKMKSNNAPAFQKKLGHHARLKAAFPSNRTFHITADDDTVQSLKNDPDVEYVEPNFKLQSIGTVVHAQNLTAQDVQNYDQTGAAVRATDAWALSSPYAANNRPIVAIVDTGIDTTHYVFTQSDALWTNPNEIAGNHIDDDLNGYVDDVYGWNFVSNSNNVTDDEDHGTHVAGIVLGATQDILASTLQPAKIQIMALKFLDSSGSGTTSAAVNAIYYAVNNGAKIINCSWGGSSYSQSLEDALTYAYNHGVLITSAAGNYSNNNDNVAMYPANYSVPSNVSVAATTDTDQLASFSNFGANSVHLGSPGLYVYSTFPGGQFATLSGTSMAAPFVAGAAALALRESTSLTGYQLKSIVMSTVDAQASLAGKTVSGGRINELALMQSAQSMVGTQAYQPSYAESQDRSPASDSTTSAAAVGCGLVRSITTSGGAGPGNPGASGVLAILFGLPLLVWFALRRQSPVSQRRFERYLMESQVKIKSGNRELVGTLKTISMGGVSFNVDEALERGGSVAMKITGPDGGVVDVEGRIVWSEANNSYGVQFGDVRDSVKDTMFGWTRRLMRQE